MDFLLVRRSRGKQRSSADPTTEDMKTEQLRFANRASKSTWAARLSFDACRPRAAGEPKYFTLRKAPDCRNSPKGPVRPLRQIEALASSGYDRLDSICGTDRLG